MRRARVEDELLRAGRGSLCRLRGEESDILVLRQADQLLRRGGEHLGHHLLLERQHPAARLHVRGAAEALLALGGIALPDGKTGGVLRVRLLAVLLQNGGALRVRIRADGVDLSLSVRLQTGDDLIQSCHSAVPFRKICV